MSEDDSRSIPIKVERVRTAVAVVRRARNGRMKMPRVGFVGMVALWWGKLRRQVEGRVRKGYIRRRHAARKGECTRCGACCMLGIMCPSLKFDESGLSACVKYGPNRNVACKIFPYTCTDLRERDRILPDVPCGYSFPDDNRPATKNARK